MCIGWVSDGILRCIKDCIAFSKFSPLITFKKDEVTKEISIEGIIILCDMHLKPTPIVPKNETDFCTLGPIF